MAYTVKKLAKLSGTTIRTLRFYDEVGLLKPAYYGENNYRYYEEEQLLMLQQILFYRELGISLDDIKRIIGSDDFDKIEALKSHKIILEKNLNQAKKLIKTIDKTILYLRGETKMRNEELFYGFDSGKQKEYEKYLVDSGKVTQEEIDKCRDKIKHFTKEDAEKFKTDSDKLHKDIVAALENKLSPSSPEVLALMKRHYQLYATEQTASKEGYIGLSQLYCEHPDFRKFYDNYHPQLLEFLVEAMKCFAEKELC